MTRRLSHASLFVAGAAFALVLVACARPGDPRARDAGPGLQPVVVLPSPAFAVAGTSSDGVPSLADVAQRTVPAVVNVSATRVGQDFQANPFFDSPLHEFFGPFRGPRGPRGPRPQKSLGSGVVVAADGVVITNNHVVEHAEDIQVTLNDGREFAAAIAGRDPKTDLAVLRLEGEVNGLPHLTLGDSDQLRLADVVLAIGNPFGVGQTVTMGIVSALGRDNVDITDYEDFIQTDAAINPGNSGGALINMRGELVGINTAILSRTGGYQGIGFAIPANMVKPIVESLLTNGTVERGWLGVTIQDLDDDLAAGLGLGMQRGVLVSDVAPGSPAEAAGLERGDVITAIDGRSTPTTRKLRNAVAAAGPDKKVSLSILRDGAARELTATLGRLEQPGQGPGKPADAGPLAGVTLRDVTAEVRRQFDLDDGTTQGVAVVSLEPSSPAARAGLRAGDVIVEVNRQPVASLAEFSNHYDASKDSVLLLVRRGATTLYFAVRE